eukprot:325666_1
MLSAPTHALNVSHSDHISPSFRNKRTSSTSRLSTWRQIRPMIYRSMLCDDKSNSEWLQKELSSFDALLREEYPKDVIPILMDDHIRFVLGKNPEGLHKSILKMLFIQIPKIKPDTVFFIPASPKQNPSKHTHVTITGLNLSANDNHIHKQSSGSSNSSSGSDTDEDRAQNDGNVIISAHHHKDTLSTQLNNCTDSLSHQYTSSLSDSNQMFLPKFQQPIHINLTGETQPNHDNTHRDSLGLSPSESSKIQGYDYHDEDVHTDDDIM